MATVSVIKLKVRRGTDAERRLITLDQGEIGYVTDTNSQRLFVGDGVTKGGNPAALRFYFGNLSIPASLATAQVGDLIYNTSTSSLNVLSGRDANNFPDYSNPLAYKFVGTQTDNASVKYNASGQLYVDASGINGSLLPTSNPGVASGRLWNDLGVVRVA
jgi:hypothetical protein